MTAISYLYTGLWAIYLCKLLAGSVAGSQKGGNVLSFLGFEPDRTLWRDYRVLCAISAFDHHLALVSLYNTYIAF